MAKENYDGMQFRLNFISEGGHLLATTEWTTDRDKIIYLADSINKHSGIRAMPETKGTGYARTVDEEGRFRLVK
jgi:hypothetical protein